MITSLVNAFFGTRKQAVNAPRGTAAKSVLLCLLLLVSAEAPAASGQAATSSVFPSNPTYVDAVTGIVTIPAVTGQAPVTGMIDYTIDGGPVATATVTTGSNYVNLGQLSIGSHVLTFQAHPSSPIAPPPSVSIPVSDQGFGFVGVYGRFNSNYTDANLFSSAGIAIDSKDTVWIADSILSKLVSFDVFGNINNIAIASLPFPIANPAGLAFDSSDNLFIADHGNSRIIKYTPAGVETVLPISGLGKPGELMLDKVKNLLYIVDQDNERVVRYDLSAIAPAGYPFSGLTAIQSIALDPAGNVYVSDRFAGFFENVNGVVSALSVNAPIRTPGGIFVDRAGQLYLTDSSINGTYRIDAQGHQTQISDFDSSFGMAEDSRGRIYFGPSTNVRIFAPAGELGVVAATTSIFSNSDQNNPLVYTMPQGQTELTQVVSPSPTFVYDVNTESCPYVEIRGTCYFNINFQPQVPGVHTGTIATTLPGGPTINTLLYGNAVGPAPAFSPGTQTQTPSGAADSEGVALDEAGNYYVSDATGNQVYETSGGVTHSLGFTGLLRPTNLAVDGAGAVYVLDSGNNRIAKLDLAGNQTYPVVAGTGNPLQTINAFALDGGGQIYFAGGNLKSSLESLYLYDRTGATSLIASNALGYTSLALDPYGDIYALLADSSLIRIDINGKQSTLAPKGTIGGVNTVADALAVDASETAYVGVHGVAAITLVHPDGTTASIPVPTLGYARGIAIDGTGSILAVDAVTNQYTFVDRTHQDFNFGDVPLNTTTTFSAFFGNAGSEPFQITTLPGDSDFQQVTTADACSTSGANSTIAAASSCDLSYTVSPTALGTITANGRVTTTASVDFDTFTEIVVNAPVLSLTPASFDFGIIPSGKTPFTTLALSNTGSAPASVDISLFEKVSNDPNNPSSSFAETSACPATLAPGASCGIVVTFNPVPGNQNTATVSVSAPGAASVSTTFTGTGAAPVLSLTPSSYDFGSVASGATPSTTLTLKNSGNAPAAVNISLFATVSNDPSNPFSSFSETSNCPASLAPGASCGIIVTFTPVAGSPGTATVSVSAAGAATLSSTLTGTGAPGTPVFSLTPATYAFGNVQPGSTPTTTLTLKNTGTANAALLISLIEKVSNDPKNPLSSFGETSNCPASLAPGASCGIVVTFTPVPGNQNSATVSVTAAGAASVSATLTGTGAAPILSLTPASYDFGTVASGNTPSTTLTLKNSGNAPATVTVSLYEKVSNGPINPLSSFSETSNCPTSLAAGSSCGIVVKFTPVAGSPGTATVSVTAAGTATVSATLTGTGAGTAPLLTLTPANVNFGSVAVGGGSATQTVTLTNVSSEDSALVGAYSVSDPGDFSYSGCTNFFGAEVLTPGQSCVLSFTFHPTALTSAPDTATFSFNYSDSDGTAQGTMSLRLTGTGQPQPPPTVTPASLNFGSVDVGATSATQTVTLTNVGSSDLLVGFSVSGAGTFSYSGCNNFFGDGVLQPGQSCVLSLNFHPTAFSSGANTGTFSLNYTDSSGTAQGTITVPLTGTGVAPPPDTPFIDFNAGFTAEALMLTGPVNIAGGALQVTSGPSSAASSAFYPTPVPTANFNTEFTFQLLDPTAEGITFTIQGDGPNAVGAGGGGLGYQGLAKSIAVKFDLKDTAGEGVDSTGIYVNGAAPTVPAVPLASSGIDLHSGHIFALRLSYDGTTMTVTLTDTVTNAVWTTQAAEDIPGITGGSTAYFGFTAGSGTPTLNSDASEEKMSLAVRPAAVAADATPAPATSNILSWIYVANGETKSAQTITFQSLSAKTYGAAPVTLAAKASSGLPVSYAVTGPAKLSDSTLTITGVGEVTVTASQAGNASFAAADPVVESFTVAKAPLTVTANRVSRAFGASNPTFSYKLSGFVDGDTASVVGGTAALATTAVPTSPAGSYPITFTSEGLTAANYSFTYVAGMLTVMPGTLVIAPATGNFGSIAVGQTSPAISFTVTNDTASTMGYLGYTNLGEFYLQPGTCHLVNGEPMLNPGKSCVFTAVFKPTKPGAVSGNLSIQTSSGTFGVPMTGTGTTLVISPASGNFGSVAVGKTSPVISFTVTNETTSTMGYLGYTNLGEFYLQPGTCHLVNGEPMLKPGQSCTFFAVFNPAKAGPVSGDMSIQTSSGTFNVPMTGTGVTQ